MTLVLAGVAMLVGTTGAAAEDGKGKGHSPQQMTVNERGAVTIAAGRTYFVNQNSGKCLNVEGASTSPGARLIQWPCQPAGAGNDEFYVNYVGGIYYTIIPANNSLCLDVTNASQDPGAQIIQWDCNGKTNQQFWFYAPDPNNLSVVAIVARHSNQVFDVAGASTADGAPVIQWPFKSSNNGNQLWRLGAV